MTPETLKRIEALVTEWRKCADTHERYRHHRDDPYDDIGHVHEVKAKRLRMCADELSALLADLDALSGGRPEIQVEHGRTCPKATHSNQGGYLHAESDDRPYDMDGVSYCGRCHVALGWRRGGATA